MTFNIFNILVCIAGALAVVAMLKPAWPILAVSVLLVCVALITKGA